MKKIILTMFLAMTCALSWSLPKPSQIEDALASGHYGEAKAMVKEVLKEKPQNARAHLLEAFLLIHVDHNVKAAGAEMYSATGLDTKGDVKKSPLYGRVVAEIEDTEKSQRAVTSQSTSVVERSHIDPMGAILPIILIMAVLFGLYFIARRVFFSPVQQYMPPSPPGTRFNTPMQSTSPVGGYYPSQPQAQPMSQGMGFAGTAASVGVGVAGGIVAGELLTEAIHGHRGSSDHTVVSDNTSYVTKNNNFGSNDNDGPSVISVDEERASFQSSSSDNDSWEPAASDSSGSFGGDEFQ